MQLYLLAAIFVTSIYSFVENKYILRSKKFDCSYLISEDSLTGKTLITKIFDGKKNNLEPIEFFNKISLVDVLEDEKFESLLCYSQDDPYALYNISLISKETRRISIEHFLTIQKNDPRYMLILEENKQMYVHAIVTDGDTIFLAVSSDKKIFGKENSFILALFISRTTGQSAQLLPLFILPITKHDMYYDNGVNSISKIRSIIFEKRTQTLLCGLDVSSSLVIDTLSPLLYIPVSSNTIKDNTGQSFLAKTLTVNQIKNTKIESSEITCNYTLSIAELHPMTTSTAVPYLILLSKGLVSHVKAFPISHTGIAKKENKPKNIFFTEGLKRFVYRIFDTKVDTLREVYESSRTAIDIGGSTALQGNIKTIKVFGDAVLVLVEQENNNKIIAQLYRSVALFESSGIIKEWTPWQPVHRQSKAIIDFELDRTTGELLIIEHDIVKRIAWNTTNISYPFLSTIQELVRDTPCIRNATLGKLMIQEKHISFFGLVTDDKIFISPLEKIEPTEITPVLMSEPFLYQEIGKLRSICMEYDANNKQNYIFITGQHGIATISLDKYGAIESVKKISDCPAIKKIIIDQDTLYALSEHTIHRGNLPLQWSPIILTEIISDTQKGDIGRLRDCIISDSVALIMGSNALWIVSPGHSIKKGIPHFEQFILPQQLGVPVSFSILSPTSKETDFARYCGGNIFVLCADLSLKRSQLYRIAIAPTKGLSVTKNTVQLFDDFIFEDKIAPFFNFGSLQETCFTDGYRFLLLSSNQQVSLSTQPGLGVVMSGNKLVKIPNVDFQNSRILYTGINQCNGELFVVTEQSVHIYN